MALRISNKRIKALFEGLNEYLKRNYVPETLSVKSDEDAGSFISLKNITPANSHGLNTDPQSLNIKLGDFNASPINLSTGTNDSGISPKNFGKPTKLGKVISDKKSQARKSESPARKTQARKNEKTDRETSLPDGSAAGTAFGKFSIPMSDETFDETTALMSSEAFTEADAPMPGEALSGASALMPGEAFNKIPDSLAGAAFAEASAAAPAAKKAARSLDDLMKNVSQTWQESLFRLIDEKGYSDTEVYKRAKVDRKLFSKIRSNPEYQPKKNTAVAFALALKLSLDEVKDFLARAGYALSPSSRFDLIIQYFVEQEVYDLYTINLTLFEHDQPLLE